MPKPGIGMLPFRRDICSFPSGALYHASVRNFAPITALLGALRELSSEKMHKSKAPRARHSA